MADEITERCPDWCQGTIHARCTGEVLWAEESFAVEIGHEGEKQYVALTRFPADGTGEPAITNMTPVEARITRDALTAALTLVDPPA